MNLKRMFLYEASTASFSIIEIIVVLVIVCIIAGLGLINYGGVREETHDKEAKANLKLIQAAEKIYHIEFYCYYPPSGSGFTPTVTQMNDNLKLSLPTAGSKWNYVVNPQGTSEATRTDTTARKWKLTIINDEPCKVGSPGCP